MLSVLSETWDAMGQVALCLNQHFCFMTTSTRHAFLCRTRTSLFPGTDIGDETISNHKFLLNASWLTRPPRYLFGCKREAILLASKLGPLQPLTSNYSARSTTRTNNTNNDNSSNSSKYNNHVNTTNSDGNSKGARLGLGPWGEAWSLGPGALGLGEAWGPGAGYVFSWQFVNNDVFGALPQGDTFL